MENAEENSENSGLSLSDNGDSSLTSLGESEEEIVDSFVTPPIREVIGEEKLREYMQSKPHVYTRGEGPNGKNIDGLLLSFIRMSSLPVETEEELRQRKEIEFLNRLEAKQRLENMKKARAVKANGNSSTETQKLAIQGASGSGSGSDSSVRAVASDVSLEEEMFRNLMLNMPLVSTRCVGPNGEKTQGRLLYEYKEGEEVKIVCVCHGYFLSPAEFVKHAGGGDVENPLRHITIKHVANW